MSVWRHVSLDTQFHHSAGAAPPCRRGLLLLTGGSGCAKSGSLVLSLNGEFFVRTSLALQPQVETGAGRHTFIAGMSKCGKHRAASLSAYSSRQRCSVSHKGEQQELGCHPASSIWVQAWRYGITAAFLIMYKQLDKSSGTDHLQLARADSLRPCQMRAEYQQKVT